LSQDGLRFGRVTSKATDGETTSLAATNVGEDEFVRGKAFSPAAEVSSKDDAALKPTESSLTETRSTDASEGVPPSLAERQDYQAMMGRVSLFAQKHPTAAQTVLTQLRDHPEAIPAIAKEGLEDGKPLMLILPPMDGLDAIKAINGLVQHLGRLRMPATEADSPKGRHVCRPLIGKLNAEEPQIDLREALMSALQTGLDSATQGGR
jgi:hypothetical protein